jgi:UvrD-like helicase C-terminal domain/AAA domain
VNVELRDVDRYHKRTDERSGGEGVVTQVGIAKGFKADLAELPGPIARKALVWLTDYLTNPDDARLEAHRIERSLMPNLWTAKLDDSYRVIYRLDQDGVRHLLLCDTHDRAYRRAEKLRAVNVGGVVEVVEAAPPEALPPPERPSSVDGPRQPGRSFMAWTDRELETAGVPAHALPGVRALDSDDDLLDFCAEAGALGELLLKLHEDGPPELAARLDLVLPKDRDPAAPGKVDAALKTEAASASVVMVDSKNELERVLAQPIEDWMIYLHPGQVAAVRRPLGGPARVSGPAGTGKTVVALHRAAFIARELARRGDDGPVLVATFIKSLPVVLNNLFERLAPDVADRVEFDNVHGWASALLKSRRLPYNVNPTLTERLFEEALECQTGTRLQVAGLNFGYLSEEVQYFVKGRALSNVEEYLALPRTSRGTPLHAQQRRDVWEVAERYRLACERERVRDFGDLLVGALRNLENRPLDRPYAAIIVDEAQDLTEAGLKMLVAALRPGGELLLVGDGQQSIYPGSFSLRSVGLDVRGRSTVLTASYRSSRRLLEAALAVMAGHRFDDLDEEAVDGRRKVTWLRDGEPPLLRGFADAEAERRFVVADVAARAAAGEVDLGDIAVFCARTADVKAMLARFKQRRIAAQDLTAYKGRTTRAVKVGTYHRAKGLEFKEVYLPHVSDGLMPAASVTADLSDARELARRQFFVGMTRARDRLVISWSGAPSGFLGPLLEA